MRDVGTQMEIENMGVAAWTPWGFGEGQVACTVSSLMVFLLFSPVESVVSPPELPPRNIPLSAGSCEAKEVPLSNENPRATETSRPSLSETLFQRLQSMDTSG